MKKNPSSFRDPSGFLFQDSGIFFRAVNHSYREEYDAIVADSLFKNLMKKGWLLEHEELDSCPKEFYKILKPLNLPMISYPYEWSFGQLKDAALLTLEIQYFALESGYTLKDANGFNIQFFEGKPILIDSLSFERYQTDMPWIAYGQFIRHFYAPLALMSKVSLCLNQLLKIHLDGIPLRVASELLPFTTKLQPSILTHIHLHSKFEEKYANSQIVEKNIARISKSNLLAILDQLISSIKNLKPKHESTHWGDYNGEASYSANSIESKKSILKNLSQKINFRSVWDFGSNDGTYTRIFSHLSQYSVAFDMDPVAVENNYLNGKNTSDTKTLALQMDLLNPSPALGWNHHERLSLKERGPVDLILCFALIHHLCLSHHISLGMLARFFSDLTSQLLIEFVPLDDPMAQKLVSGRRDQFKDYNESTFEQEFNRYFSVVSKESITGSQRVIYFMRKG